MVPPTRSAGVRGLYGDESSRRETPPPPRSRIFRRSRRGTDAPRSDVPTSSRPRSSQGGTDTPDSGFFDGEQEDDIPQSELDQIIRLQAAEETVRRRRRHEEQDAEQRAREIEAAEAQADEAGELNRAIAASIASAEQAKEEEELEHAMIQSQIEHEAAVRRRAEQEAAARQQAEQEAARERREREEAALQRAEQEEIAEAIRQSRLEEKAAARWRREEQERERGFNDAEEEEQQRAVVAESELEDRQLSVEAQRFRGSVERSQAAASRISKPVVPRKPVALSVASKASTEALDDPESVTRLTPPEASASPVSSRRTAASVASDHVLEEPDRAIRAVFQKTPKPPVPPKEPAPSVESEEIFNEANHLVGAPSFPSRSSLQASPSQASPSQVPSPRVSYQQIQHEHQATQTFTGPINPFDDAFASDAEPDNDGDPEPGEQVDMGRHAAARRRTPLPAPVPRRTEVPDWAIYRPPSVVSSSSGSTRNVSSQNDTVDAAFQPPAPSSSQNASNTAFSSRALENSVSADSLSLELSSVPPQSSQPSPPIQYNTYNGSVTNIHHHYQVTVPVTLVEKKESNKLLKQAFRGLQRMRGKENSGSSANATAFSSSQAQSIGSQIRSGLEHLNLRGDRYVTAADMARPVIDEGYDSPTPSESFDTNPQLLADLEGTDRRLQTPAQDSYQPSRADENGSPTSFRNPPLHLVTSRSPTSSVVPARRPVPSSRASSLYADPRDEDVPQGLPTQRQGLGIANANVADREAPTRSSIPDTAQFAQNEQLSHQLLSAPDRPLPPPPTYLRPPVPDVELTAADTSLYEQYPVGIPDADRHLNDTPSSTFAEPDTPEYQQAALIRRHNPPRTSDWANVPAPHEHLAYTNSRAMSDVDRFGHDSQTAMPTLPALASDRENVPRRKATPNTRARDAEKDAQKSMRSKM